MTKPTRPPSPPPYVPTPQEDRRIRHTPRTALRSPRHNSGSGQRRCHLLDETLSQNNEHFTPVRDGKVEVQRLPSEIPLPSKDKDIVLRYSLSMRVGPGVLRGGKPEDLKGRGETGGPSQGCIGGATPPTGTSGGTRRGPTDRGVPYRRVRHPSPRTDSS